MDKVLRDRRLYEFLDKVDRDFASPAILGEERIRS